MTTYKSTDTIYGYHAHIYFDAQNEDQAKVLCEKAAALFDVEMGRFHQRPVGPHPMFSCQLSCNPTQFMQLLPWLALNREELIVFCHPDTGDHLADHTQHVIWLGEAQELKLSMFNT